MTMVTQGTAIGEIEFNLSAFGITDRDDMNAIAATVGALNSLVKGSLLITHTGRLKATVSTGSLAPAKRHSTISRVHDQIQGIIEHKAAELQDTDTGRSKTRGVSHRQRYVNTTGARGA